jgi:hypothetical protein
LMPLADARKVDLGYASTSHAAQGATVDPVLVNIDSSRGAQLVNGRIVMSRFPGLASMPAFIPMTRSACGGASRGRRRRN